MAAHVGRRFGRPRRPSPAALPAPPPQVLDLCTDEELEALYSILYGASPFSPVVKSLVREKEPPMLQQRGRASIMHKARAPTASPPPRPPAPPWMQHHVQGRWCSGCRARQRAAGLLHAVEGSRAASS